MASGKIFKSTYVLNAGTVDSSNTSGVDITLSSTGVYLLFAAANNSNRCGVYYIYGASTTLVFPIVTASAITITPGNKNVNVTSSASSSTQLWLMALFG